MNLSWMQHFMDVAGLTASRSKDPDRQVGAVIVDTMRRAVGSGYNGFPRGVRDAEERYRDTHVKLKLIVHAEANAILNSVAAISGCILFCTSYPCSECAKLIIQSGLYMVVSPPPKANSKWAEDAVFSRLMFDEAKVHHHEWTGKLAIG